MPRAAFHETIAGKFKGKAAAIAEGNVKAFDAGYAEGAGDLQARLHRARPGAREQRRCRDDERQHRRSSQAAWMPASRPSSAIRSRPRPRSSRCWRRACPGRAGGCCRPRTRSRRSRPRSGRAMPGARAATATSGPGLALMTEMMGLGVMAEVPVVIFVSQRGGPSTGMPTKTEQSDLNLAVYGGSGDAKRIVLAPTNVEGCYRCAGRAFELAEQVPDAGHRAARPVPVEPAGERRRARQDAGSRRTCRRASRRATRRRGLPALRAHRRLDQPARHPGRARRHPHRDRPRAQRGSAGPRTRPRSTSG